jgi:hypothetical protein
LATALGQGARIDPAAREHARIERDAKERLDRAPPQAALEALPLCREVVGLEERVDVAPPQQRAGEEKQEPHVALVPPSPDHSRGDVAATPRPEPRGILPQE